MKRLFIFFLLALMLAVGFSGCGSSKNNVAKKTDAPKLKIVATIFPEYSWTKELLGSHEKDLELTLLANKGDGYAQLPAQRGRHFKNCRL